MTTNTQVNTTRPIYYQEIDTAQIIFFQIQMIQKMAYSAEHAIDENYKIIDYVSLLDEHLYKLKDSLDKLEQILYTINNAD